MAQIKELPKTIDMSGTGYDLVLKTARQDVKKNGSPMQCKGYKGDGSCGTLIHKGEKYYNKEYRMEFCHFTNPVCVECGLKAAIEAAR